MTDERISLPLLGVEVETGQLEAVDEDGVATAPIVQITLLGINDHRFTFTVPAEMGESISETIATATRASLATYYKPREMEARLRRRRRDKRLAILLVAFMLGSWMAMSGLGASVRYVHTGGVVDGVFGAIAAGFEIAGVFVVCFILGRYVADVKNRRARKKAPAPPS